MLKDNISFCITHFQQNDWRSEYTRGIIEHYKRQLGGRLTTATSFTQAVNMCQTKYILFIRSGMVILSQRFFDHLERFANEQRDIVIGDIELGYDYAYLRDEILFVNVELWKRFGSVAFDAKSMSAPSIIPSEKTFGDRHPAYIFMDKAHNVNVDFECYDRGAAVLIEQMKAFFDARSLPTELRAELFYLDRSSPYNEIHFETKFETETLPKLRERVDAFDTPQISELISNKISADTIIVPAKGLYTRDMIMKTHAKNIIIYSDSMAQLKLQEKILNLMRATNYENILLSYLSENPAAEIIGDPKQGRSIIIQPHARYSLKMVHINPIGYQLEQLVKQVSIHESLVLDVGEYYTDPVAMYKRDRRALPGYFEALYAQFSSRPGPSFLVGVDPNYTKHAGTHINNLQWRYELRQSTLVDEGQ